MISAIENFRFKTGNKFAENIFSENTLFKVLFFVSFNFFDERVPEYYKELEHKRLTGNNYNCAFFLFKQFQDKNLFVNQFR